MPNTLTSIFVSNPATEPVEAPHPNTGVYVTGTQAVAGGPWYVVHTLITKTTTPLTMVGRLKNFPTVTVSVVASGGPNAGNIFNNILATPAVNAGNATGTSTSAISVTVASIANQAGYRLLASDASAGPFTQIYQGTAAAFPHTGLTAAQTKWYKWQYVGGVGTFYDDSALSPVFSGTSTAAGPFQLVAPQIMFLAGQSEVVGKAPTADLNTLKPSLLRQFQRVLIQSHTTPYTYTKLQAGVNNYGAEQETPNGTFAPAFGPELELADQWETANPTATLILVKAPVSGTFLTQHLKGTSIYADLLARKTDVFAYVTAAGLTPLVRAYVYGQGEADAMQVQATNAAISPPGQANPTRRTNELQFISDLTADGLLPAGVFYVYKGVRGYSVFNTDMQAGLANETRAKYISTDSYAVLSDGLHYAAVSEISYGKDVYNATVAAAAPAYSGPVVGNILQETNPAIVTTAFWANFATSDADQGSMQFTNTSVTTQESKKFQFQGNGVRIRTYSGGTAIGNLIFMDGVQQANLVVPANSTPGTFAARRDVPATAFGVHTFETRSIIGGFSVVDSWEIY